MSYYIVDATGYLALDKKYDKSDTTHLFNMVKDERAFLYMPQFSVTDVLNRLTKKYIKEKKLSKNQYEEACKRFIDRIRGRELIYIYDLHRYHNLNAKEHEIYKKYWEYAVKNKLKQEEQKFGAQQMLVIAMALELRRQLKGCGEIRICSGNYTLIDVAAIYGFKVETSVF